MKLLKTLTNKQENKKISTKLLTTQQTNRNPPKQKLLVKLSTN